MYASIGARGWACRLVRVGARSLGARGLASLTALARCRARAPLPCRRGFGRVCALLVRALWAVGRVCGLLVRTILLCAAFARRGGVALSALGRARGGLCGPRGRTLMAGASLGGTRRSVLGRLVGSARKVRRGNLRLRREPFVTEFVFGHIKWAHLHRSPSFPLSS